MGNRTTATVSTITECGLYGLSKYSKFEGVIIMKIVNESIYGSINNLSTLSTYTRITNAESILNNYNIRFYPLSRVNDLKEGVYYNGPYVTREEPR